MKMALLPLFCGMLLSGCATKSSVCADYPQPPIGDYTQRNVAVYAIEAKAAWMGCRDRAEGLQKLVNLKSW